MTIFMLSEDLGYDGEIPKAAFLSLDGARLAIAGAEWTGPHAGNYVAEEWHGVVNDDRGRGAAWRRDYVIRAFEVQP